MSKSKKDMVILSSNLFPVVGIGASAGGLDAFKKLLKAIPENSGMAYILVQHLNPAHESILTDLLQRVTKIPVQEITNNIKVVADHIYIIPSNKLLTASDGILQLTKRPPKNQKNMPIDVFFSSLAEVHQSHAIGVVLSGTGRDGTLGLKAIKDRGGITFAQEQQSAAYGEMPQSAIDAGVVDFIHPPEKIPLQLLNLNINKVVKKEDSETKKRDDEYVQILSLLRIKKGVDFTYYKQSTIRRRIARRAVLNNKSSMAEYLVYLKENGSEQDILYQDMLIPVTQFFRDPKISEVLTGRIFPILLKEKPDNEPLRIWVAGCSTGQEVYSIVMCLQEYLGKEVSNSILQVFATDISEVAITKARSGLYKSNEVKEVSELRLQQFFTKSDNKFRINKSIRDCCVFAYHNFLKEPPFAKIDLISCRNLLIYLEPVLQKNALTCFHYSLKEEGFLILGKSETIAPAIDLYNTFDKNSKIYRRKTVRGKFLHVIENQKDENFRRDNHPLRSKVNLKEDFQKNADDVLLSKFAPPGVVVNDQLDIVQFRGETGLWLEPSPGRPNLNVLKMVRQGLTFELRNALHKVKMSKESLTKEDISIQFMGKEHLVTIEVIPLLDTSELHYLILFRDQSLPVDNDVDQSNGNKHHGATESKQSREKLRIKKLQNELALSLNDMRSITEYQEASNEELQSANEELLSGSEELQSLNEELETSREEIQTSNEELVIVNQELFDRNEQLNRSRLYSDAIVTTIREPLIILNNNLQVRSANKAFYKKFQTTEALTEGKLLFELGNKQWDIPGLRKMLEKILPGKESIADFEVVHNFPGLGERIMLFNASRIFIDNSEEQLILVAIEDISEKRKKDTEVRMFSEELEEQVSERTFSLEQANIDLLHSNKNLEQFAYIASHDLQEPLRKIITFSGLLHDRFQKDLPKGASDLVVKITHSSERMGSLIKQVLNFSKILYGELHWELTDLNYILNKVIEDFELLITEKKAVIKRKRLPVIEAIPLQINQLFYNLLSNSLKFSREIPPVVTITSKILGPGDLKKHSTLNKMISYCQISFKDNGIGFDQESSDKIFLIFHRLNSREKFSGTGIGLALCKSIVFNHHGEIRAFSKRNKGARFEVILPLKQ